MDKCREITQPNENLTKRTNVFYCVRFVQFEWFEQCKLSSTESILIGKQIDERNRMELNESKKRKTSINCFAYSSHRNGPRSIISIYSSLSYILDSVFVHSKTNRNKRIDYTNIPPKSKLNISWCTIHHQLNFMWSVWIFGEH